MKAKDKCGITVDEINFSSRTAKYTLGWVIKQMMTYQKDQQHNLYLPTIANI
jgi:hypothetical protein